MALCEGEEEVWGWGGDDVTVSGAKDGQKMVRKWWGWHRRCGQR